MGKACASWLVALAVLGAGCPRPGEEGTDDSASSSSTATTGSTTSISASTSVATSSSGAGAGGDAGGAGSGAGGEGGAGAGSGGTSGTGGAGGVGGACDAGCLGGACVDGTCEPVAIVDGNAVAEIALDGATLYFIEDTGDGFEIRSRPAMADPSAAAETFASALYTSRALTIGPEDVFWADDETGEVFRKPKQRGGDDPHVIANVARPRAMVVAGGALFIAGQEGGEIQRVDLDVGDVTPFATGLLGPLDVAADATHLYFVDASFEQGRGDVLRAPLDDGSAVETLARDLDDPAHLVLLDGVVYFTTSEGLFTVDAAGGEQDPVSLADGNATRVAVDHAEAFFYEPGAGSLVAVPLGGEPSADVVAGDFGVTDIAASDGVLFWSTDPFSATPGLRRQVR